jgi:hypothetical protein
MNARNAWCHYCGRLVHVDNNLWTFICIISTGAIRLSPLKKKSRSERICYSPTQVVNNVTIVEPFSVHSTEVHKTTWASAQKR